MAGVGRGADGLTDKQRAFVNEYLNNGRNGSAAYRTIYKSTMRPTLVAQRAAELVRHRHIAAIIAEADAKVLAITAKRLDRYAITKARVAEEMALLAFSNMGDYSRVEGGMRVPDLSNLNRQQLAAITELDVEYGSANTSEDDSGSVTAPSVKRVRFKLGDKRQALVNLSQIMGYIVDRKDIRVIQSVADLNDDELNALAIDLKADSVTLADRSDD